MYNMYREKDREYDKLFINKLFIYKSFRLCPYQLPIYVYIIKLFLMTAHFSKVSLILKLMDEIRNFLTSPNISWTQKLNKYLSKDRFVIAVPQCSAKLLSNPVTVA